jgi:sulfoxide reductase heme-binding subunit YedZ
MGARRGTRTGDHVLLATSDPRALWYLTRGFGLVALVLLSVSVALGVAELTRFTRPGLPRFVVAGLHRNASLLAVILLAVHIATAVADPFAPISVADVFIPFVGTYRPLWLGLGALGSDLLVALVVTSLIRQRIGLRTWRAVHWCAYACWPVAVVHGLGTGSDTRLGWVQLLYVGCVALVVVAVGWRLATSRAAVSGGRRLVAGAGALLIVGTVSVWTADGPLRAGWARRAGTPPALLQGSSPTTEASRR